MNEQRNIPLWVSLPFIGFLIIKWFMEGLIRNITIFRRTILWMIAATVAVYMGKPALIGLVIFAIITAIIAWVKLGAVIRSIGNKFANKNEKVSEVFNKIADVVETVYPTLRKIVRFFSFVPDFQRFGKLVQRNAALAKGNAFMKNIGAIPRNMGFWENRKKYSIYKVKEHNGEIVKDNKETMGNQVIYLGEERKYHELPLFNNMTFDDVIEAAENKIGSVMTDVAPNSYFMGTPAVKIEFIANLDDAILKGNQFLKDEGIVNDNDNNLYDVEVVDEEAGMTVFVNEKINNNISDTVQKFKKAAENNSIKYLDIQQDGNKLVVKYLFNVDYDVDRANDLLRSVGVIQKDDKHLYDVRMFDNSVGNPTIVIPEQIGYETIESVYNKLVGVRSNYGSKYVDLKPKNDERDPWMTFEYVRTINPDVERAHDLLREAGVLDKSSAEIVGISMSVNSDEAVFKLDSNDEIYGKNTQDIVNAVEKFKERFNAKTMRSVSKPDGSTEVLFVIKDFLDEGKMFDGIPPLNLDNISIPSAVDPFGNDYYVSFSEVAGAVIMGQPGSGKTASALVFLSPIAASEDTIFDLIDCKGGADWNTISAGVDNHIRGAYTREDLERITEYLKELEEDMNDRIKNMENRLGYSSFWDKDLTAEDRRKAGVKYRMLVVDECQDLFGKSGTRGMDKDISAMYSDIETRLINLVKKGRSSGITVVFITQKPTQSSLPTDIRDNCAIRISFKVNAPGLVNLFFGLEGGVPAGQPSPVNIPKKRQGGAVLFNDDTQEFNEVRFYYIKQKVMKEYMEAAVSDERKEAKRKREEEIKQKAEERKEQNNDQSEERSERTRGRNSRPTREESEKTEYRSARRGSTESDSEEKVRENREAAQKEREEKMRERREAAQKDKEEKIRVKREQQPVEKLEGEALRKEIVKINRMIKKSQDMAASEEERDTAKRMAERVMKRHGITMKELTA